MDSDYINKQMRAVVAAVLAAGTLKPEDKGNGAAAINLYQQIYRDLQDPEDLHPGAESESR